MWWLEEKEEWLRDAKEMFNNVISNTSNIFFSFKQDWYNNTKMIVGRAGFWTGDIQFLNPPVEFISWAFEQVPKSYMFEKIWKRRGQDRHFIFNERNIHDYPIHNPTP